MDWNFENLINNVRKIGEPPITIEAFERYINDLYREKLYTGSILVLLLALVFFAIFYPTWYILAVPVFLILVNLVNLAVNRYSKSLLLKNIVLIAYAFSVPLLLFIMYGESTLTEIYIIGSVLILPYVFKDIPFILIFFLTIAFSYLFNFVLPGLGPNFMVDIRMMRAFNLVVFTFLVYSSIQLFHNTHRKTFQRLLASNEAIQEKQHLIEEKNALLNKTNLNLQQKNKDFKNLAVASHHDMLEPVRTMFTLSHMIKHEMSKGKPVEKDDIEYLVAASKKLNDILQGFKQLELISTKPSWEIISIQTLIDESLYSLELILDKVTYSEPFNVYTDTKLFRIILENIFDIFLNQALDFDKVQIEVNPNYLRIVHPGLVISAQDLEPIQRHFGHQNPSRVSYYFAHKIAEILDIKIDVEENKKYSSYDIYLYLSESKINTDVQEDIRFKLK